MTTLRTVSDSTTAVTQVNENFKAVSPAALYGYNAFLTSGLNFGYYGGRAFGNTVANGTVALTGSTTNYIVANRSTGAVTSATDTTDWDDTTDFLKLYSVVTNPSSIFSMVDERQAYGAAGGGGGGSTDWADLTGIPAPIEDLAALTDPGADRLLMWDDSASEYTHATLGTGLSFTGTTLNASGGGGGSGIVETIIAGTGINVDDTDPANPVVSATGGGGGLTYFAESFNNSSPNTSDTVVQLAATDSASNVDFVLKPKGYGALLRSIPDGTTAGGTKRGTYAVDWSQFGRASADDVASGAFSVIGGGYNNRASGSESCVPGGYANVASGTGSFAAGSSSIASGSYCVAMGVGNTASTGQGAFALGGSGLSSGTYSFSMGGTCQANADYAHATGIRSNVRGIQGARVHGAYNSGGSLGGINDAQDGRYMFGATTNDATPNALTANHSGTVSAAQCLNIAVFQTIFVEGTVLARGSGAYDSKSWKFTTQLTRDGSDVSLVDTPVITPQLASAGASAWSIGISVNTTHQCLVITVTGEASLSINWGSVVQAVEIRRS